MLPHKPVKIKHPSPIRLTHSSHRRRAFGLIFWISDYRRTADVVVMLYAVLSLRMFLKGAISLSPSSLSMPSLTAMNRMPWSGK